MEHTTQEYFVAARNLLKEGDVKSACYHYFKVHEADTNNAEAEFFSAYLGYSSLLKDGERYGAVNAFKAMTQCLEVAVKCIKDSDSEESEKIMTLSNMVELYVPLTRHIFTRVSNTSRTIEEGVVGLYSLGSAIKNNFESSKEAMKLAAESWKEAVSLQSSFYAYNYKGINLEDYVAEIKKVDTAYTAPAVPMMKKIIDKIKGLINKK